MRNLTTTFILIAIFVSGCQGLPSSRNRQEVLPNTLAARVLNAFQKDDTPLDERPHDRDHEARAVDYSANRVQQAAWQESIPPEPAYDGSPIDPLRFQQDEMIRAQSSRSHQQANQLRPSSTNGFMADDIRSMPKTATERVLELTVDITNLRGEIQGLASSLQQVRSENDDLRRNRTAMEQRLNGLEQRLAVTQIEAKEAQKQYQAMNERLHNFSTKRQKQIEDLNALVDQLEMQLRLGNVQQPVQQPAPQHQTRSAPNYRR